MAELTLRDSTLFDSLDTGNQRNRKTAATECIMAVDELKRQFLSGKVKLLSLSHYHVNRENECPIWYEIKTTTTLYNNVVPDETVFYCSHYIGHCRIKGVDITICPRFGEKLQNYLINYACNLYIPQGKADYGPNQNKGQGFLLIALLWKAMLERAISIGQIPRQYLTESKRIPNFRGRLNIAKHIRTSLVDGSKFFCIYRKLSFDNTINRTIRYTLALLSQKNAELSTALQGLSEYDNKLAVFGVRDKPVTVKEIDRIQYTKMNCIYMPVMSFSRAIILHKEVEQDKKRENIDFAYFIDMAEIWELYLLKLLQQHLTSQGYRVYSPNAGYGDFLLEKQYRAIRPDIMIEKDGKCVMIIDAKYKNYCSFGRNAQEGISREDLYQMNTYLYHYGKENEPIIGLFVSPVPMQNNNGYESYKFGHNSKHQIGLLNLDLLSLDKENDVISNLHEKEAKFIEKILAEIKPKN